MDGRQSKRGYRRHSAQFKRQVLAEGAAPGARIVEVAAAHGLHPNLIYYWRSRSAESGVIVLLLQIDTVFSRN